MTPIVIPDHTLLRPIGRGAYGEVWLARNIMGTMRAVKVIRREQFESARPFEREFAGIQRYEPVSRSSGGLVHVLHVGRNDAERYFYYVMELADDAGAHDATRPAESQSGPGSRLSAPFDVASYAPRTLRSDLKRFGRLSTAQCLRLGVDVASGLLQLHRHGLIHRDVKPGNIIYVNGRAKLADIGLVTAEGEGRTFVGTEGYVPPEGPGSPSADLYALGVVLFQASTGFPPERLPDVPTEWFTSRAGDQALEFHEVVLKACEAQRERRYHNTEALQADLALLQSGQSVRHARRLQRRYARLRLAGVGGATLLVLTLGATFLANYRAHVAAQNQSREAELRQKAQSAEAQAKNAEREARRQLQAALYEEARALVLSKEIGHRSKALEAIQQAAGGTNAVELRRVAFAALDLPDLRLEREVALPPGLGFAQVDPKLQRIALGAKNGPVQICSLPDLKLLAVLVGKTQNDSFDVRWSPDARFLAVKRRYDVDGSRCDLEVWNVGQTQLLFTAGADISYNAFAFAPRRSTLAVGHASGQVGLWDLETITEQRLLRLPKTVVALAYSPDGERLAASYADETNAALAVYDVSTGNLLSSTESPEPVALIVWHPSGRWLSFTGNAASDWQRGIWLWDPESNSMTLLGRHKIKTAGLSFSPEGNYLLSCGWERELFCWDLRTRERVFTFTGAGYGLDWSPDGTRCATIPKGQSVQLFAFDRPECLEVTGNPGQRLRPGAFSPNGRFLTLLDGNNLCIWDLRCGSQPAVLETKPVPLQPFFSSDNSELFLVDGVAADAGLHAWNINAQAAGTRQPQLTPLAITSPHGLRAADLFHNTLVLTSGEGVHFVDPINLASGQGRFLKIHAGGAATSPDGRWLAVTYPFSSLVTIYSLPAMEPTARLATSNYVAGVWFSPASEELTVINRSGIEQWDAATWRLKRRDPGAPVAGSYVIYLPDGGGVWRVTNFRDTALYDRNTLEPILPLPPNAIPLAVSSDGRQLAIGIDDRRVQVWDLSTLRSRFKELGLDWASPSPK